MTRKLLLFSLLIIVLALLSGCRSLIVDSETATPDPITQPTEEVLPVDIGGGIGSQELQPIIVEHVLVEVGVGSPIPVLAQISGTWPTLCAQLAEITVDHQDYVFDIALLADPGPADCPPDNVGLHFSLRLPINVTAGLADGQYTVTANGVSGTFEIPVTPTVPVDPTTGAPLDNPPQGEGEPNTVAGLCPQVPRPAVALSLPGEGYVINNPLSGAECQMMLDGDISGAFQATADAIYYSVFEDGSYVVRRLAQGDGQSSDLSFTSVNQQDAQLFHSFVISNDGSRIAWAKGGPADGQSSGAPVSQSWVASIDGSDVVSPLPAYESDEMQHRALVPVRFSADNGTLYYTIQPMGLGGSWASFVGRYDNLYALRLNSEAPPTLVFDCAEHGLMLCIGDFYDLDGQLSALAYVDEGSVVVQNGAGEVLNTLTPDAEYVAYPTFGPGGELVFYSADLSDSSVMPERANLHRVAPPTAPDEVLVSDPGLLVPRDWLDDTHVVVSYTAGEDSWTTALVGLDGSLQVISSHPSTGYVDVLRAAATP